MKRDEVFEISERESCFDKIFKIIFEKKGEILFSKKYYKFIVAIMCHIFLPLKKVVNWPLQKSYLKHRKK